MPDKAAGQTGQNRTKPDITEAAARRILADHAAWAEATAASYCRPHEAEVREFLELLAGLFEHCHQSRPANIVRQCNRLANDVRATHRAASLAAHAAGLAAITDMALAMVHNKSTKRP